MDVPSHNLTADLQGGVDHDGFRTQHLIGDDSILESRLNGEGREAWIDAGLPDRGERELLADYARALGVAHMVEGHVPSPVVFADEVKRNRGEMFQRFGLLFLIDTGMSEGRGRQRRRGSPHHLRRWRGKSVRNLPGRNKITPLWDNDRSRISAVRRLVREVKNRNALQAFRASFRESVCLRSV